MVGFFIENRKLSSVTPTVILAVMSLLSAISDILNKESLERLAEKYSKDDMIKYCILYVDAHCTEDISLSDMTKRSAVSRAQFSKLFKDASGPSFNDYLNRKRIQRARFDQERRDDRRRRIRLWIFRNFHLIS